jgi:hypothetical protein
MQQGGGDNVSLYETDYVKWAEEQATLLTERRFDLLDLDNLIEEVDDLAGRHRDALQSQMQRLLVHLLKLTYTVGSREPERAWRRSARDARKEIDKLISRYPSLRNRLQHECCFSYPRAVTDAHDELSDYGDDHEPFPVDCPWTLEELLDREFWPR